MMLRVLYMVRNMAWICKKCGHVNEEEEAWYGEVIKCRMQMR